MKQLALTAFFSLALLPSQRGFAADPSYDVSKTDASLAAGGKGKASVTITAKNGWHLNAEAPLTLKLAPAPGVTVDKEKLVRADLAMSTPASARFDVGVTSGENGKKSVQAEASFVLCQEDSCRPVKEKLSFEVDVRTPAEPAAPATTSGKHPAKKRS
jgi:hypothetical protein